MLPIISDLLQSTVGNVVNKLTDHFLPASMSEKEKTEFKLKANELIIEEEKVLQAQMETINATMREEAKSDHWAQWLWRPCVGFTFSAVIINNFILLPYFSKYGMQPIIIPDGIWTAILVVLGVSAGTRGWEKIEKAKK